VPADGTADGTDDDRPPPLPDGVGAEYHGLLNCLKGGIVFADRITTVRGVGYRLEEPA